jgi:hypothetical protein
MPELDLHDQIVINTTRITVLEQQYTELIKSGTLLAQKDDAQIQVIQAQLSSLNSSIRDVQRNVYTIITFLGLQVFGALAYMIDHFIIKK